MQKTTNKEILVPADVADGLITVLNTALQQKQLKGKEKKLAKLYVAMLEKAVQTRERRANVGLSILLIADILRVILMIIKPDPIVKAVIGIFWRGL